MELDELKSQLGGSTSRRKIVTTGAKMAYAAPLVAASFKLSAHAAGAIRPGGECETFACGGGLCLGTFDDPIEERCACFETVARPGHGICNGDFFCGGPTCTSDADCGAGTCVTNTCCGLGVQLCAPPCGFKGTSVQTVRSGPTASGH